MSIYHKTAIVPECAKNMNKREESERLHKQLLYNSDKEALKAKALLNVTQQAYK